MRKLRSLPESAMLSVKHAECGLLNRIDDAGGNPSVAPRKRLRLRDRAFHHLRLLHHVAMFFLKGCGDAGQYALETRSPITICRRKISASIKRLTVGSKKRSERPSPLSADRADRRLIPAVNVRTFVAIHFHRDEMLIHYRCNRRIVVRLAIHHMAPVAPDRPNIKQHRLVLAL